VAWLLIGLGGFLGAMARFAVVRFWSTRWDYSFPLATWQVNVLGSFLLGLVIAAPGFDYLPDENLRLFLGVGFQGAFTTFSTFAYQILELMEEGKVGIAALYLGASVIMGILACWAGIWLGNVLFA